MKFYEWVGESPFAAVFLLVAILLIVTVIGSACVAAAKALHGCA